MNLSAQDVVRDGGVTEGCCFSKSISSSSYYSINGKVTKDQSIALKEIEEELQGSTTAEEREYVTNEMIGLGVQEMDESEEFIARNLELLENQLTRATGSIRLAYDRALKMNPSFVTNKKFRIMFLRAEQFDAKKAARRMLLHFKYKLDLFGESKLVKDITFDDLSPLDQACLYSGCCQSLPSVKDKWGRHITFQFHTREQIVSWEHSTRADWYQAMVQAQQEESLQKLGVVIVSVGFPPKGSLPILLRRLPIMAQALPFRISAFHRCLINEKKTPYLAATLLRAVGSNTRFHVRFHFEESVTSCLYNLFLYGIDPARVPLGDDGQPQRELFLELLEKQKLIERQQQTPRQLQSSCRHKTSEAATTKIDLMVPRSNDVLLGRGTIPHQGNGILDKIIEMDVVLYKNATSKFDKSCIVMTTIQKMKSIGGRFLKCVGSSNGNRRTMDEKEWVLATDQEVHDSISGRFRKKVRKINSMKKNSTLVACA